MSIRFGHCIGCDQPISPSYLSFKVMQATGDGNNVTEWEEVDVCGRCAVRLRVFELHGLVSGDWGGRSTGAVQSWGSAIRRTIGHLDGMAEGFDHGFGEQGRKLAADCRDRAATLRTVLAEIRAASGTETEGEDRNGLRAEHDGPAPKGDAQQ